MKSFLTKKICNITFGVFFSTVVFLGVFTAMYFGESILESKFFLGSVIIAFSPLAIFFTAFFYQGNVIFPIRQISVEPTEGMTSFQKGFVLSVKSAYSFAKYIPLIITIFAAILSITFIPGSIGNAAFKNGDFFEMLIASLLISGNFILFLKMASQIIISNKARSV